MASAVGRVFKATGALLVYLIVFDVVGVIGCLVLDVFSMGFGSSLLSCAVWFVLGVFCGGMYLLQGGAILSNAKDDAWIEGEGGQRAALGVIVLATVTLSLLSLPFYVVRWRYHHPSEELYVPDSAAATLTFFISILASMALFRYAAKKGKKTEKKKERK
jgi:hypothetical protein